MNNTLERQTVECLSCFGNGSIRSDGGDYDGAGYKTCAHCHGAGYVPESAAVRAERCADIAEHLAFTAKRLTTERNAERAAHEQTKAELVRIQRALHWLATNPLSHAPAVECAEYICGSPECINLIIEAANRED